MSKREVTSFTPPYIDPSITDPAAAKYRQMAEKARYNERVAGGPTPPIPRLDQPHKDGMTMADQARVSGQAPAAPAIPPSIFQPPAPAAPPGPATQVGRAPLLPTDLLPEAAKQDPAFREGHGSMYASSQPHLAYKYGVLRNKNFVPPQMLTTGKGGLKQETVEGLKALQEFQSARAKAENNEEAQVEAASAASSAGAAASLGQDKQDAAPLTEADKKKLIDGMDDFDFHTFREMMMKDLLNNEEQRKIVEAGLMPMDLTDLVMQGYITQLVAIVPNKLEYEFQSVAAEDDLALKRLIVKEAKGFNVDDRYILDKYSMMSMTVGLRAVNKKPLPDHHDQKGNFDEELFWVKFNMLTKMPLHMLASIGINFFWFDIRVRKLFVAEKLGNG